MKICVAQTRSLKGDILKNIENHLRFIELAIAFRADLIVFPELSLTGYEPELAGKLASDVDDARLRVFQEISDKNQVTVCVGMPVKSSGGIRIGMIIFQPDQDRLVYAKQYLHADELPYFVPGEKSVHLNIRDTKIALVICYELSVPEHSENAFKNGADVYLTSVAKTADGVEKAEKSLSQIAESYSMITLMSNSIGPSDNFIGAGKSAVWHKNGELAGQLSSAEEGLLIFDTETQELIQKTI
ncbi:carbon-nitrogen hydrolase family protein [Emticicia sp. CRIBPO]|uniref:carbon-nitrogen hydrolase family protein n=1 Tax=Emticicia sp. CRIBPO TaxID=2683258 RepID=UPI001411E190|nr:carbon-nitrogen hydrolase family protein [Emticicia sp. CRIBPO]NBA86534.1 carbon-nitrogen hydrolase family protein [Emticicia sp. CRIBPO]